MHTLVTGGDTTPFGLLWVFIAVGWAGFFTVILVSSHRNRRRS